MVGQWQGIEHFWHMGGYAPTVFGCYGVVLGCVAYTAWRTRKRYQKVLAQLQVRSETGACQ